MNRAVLLSLDVLAGGLYVTSTGFLLDRAHHSKEFTR